MQEIRALVRLLAIGSCLLAVNADYDGCQFPASTCHWFKKICAKGINDLFIFESTQKSPCDGFIGRFCDTSKGTFCKLGISTPPDGGHCFNLKKWRQRALKQTNRYRAFHDASSLQEDTKLDEIAQEYAEQLVVSGSWESGCPYAGESIFRDGSWSWMDNYVSRTYRPERAIDWFYNEFHFWNFESGQPYGQQETRHFTQLVWKASRKVGYGVASDMDCRQIVVVAIYDPPGNRRGRFMKNVAAPISGSGKVPDGCHKSWFCR